MTHISKIWVNWPILGKKEWLKSLGKDSNIFFHATYQENHTTYQENHATCQEITQPIKKSCKLMGFESGFRSLMKDWLKSFFWDLDSALILFCFSSTIPVLQQRSKAATVAAAPSRCNIKKTGQFKVQNMVTEVLSNAVDKHYHDIPHIWLIVEGMWIQSSWLPPMCTLKTGLRIRQEGSQSRRLRYGFLQGVRKPCALEFNIF